MTLPVNTFDQTVAQQQAQMNAVSTQLLDFSTGSILLALVEANAGNNMWLQAIATSLLAVTRLSTSFGNDVDTFIQDFNFFRFQGSPASGTVTFSRLSTGIQGVIPVGTVISVPTANNLTYIVTTPPAGSSYPAYNADLNAYVIITSALNCIAPVTCQQSGSIGNVAANTITTINSSIVGVSFVTNASAFTNGEDIWSDAKTKAEFVLYIMSLARATKAAIEYSLTIVPGIARFNLVENKDEMGNTQYGFFYAVIDDGTGNASSQLIANAKASIELYRGFTIQYDVIAPTTITANIVIGIHLISAPTETNSIIIANIQASVTAFINALTFEQTLYLSRLPELAYDADPNVLDVATYTINGVSSDLTAPLPKNVIIPGTITVNIS